MTNVGSNGAVSLLSPLVVEPTRRPRAPQPFRGVSTSPHQNSLVYPPHRTSDTCGVGASVSEAL